MLVSLISGSDIEITGRVADDSDLCVDTESKQDGICCLGFECDSKFFYKKGGLRYGERFCEKNIIRIAVDSNSGYLNELIAQERVELHCRLVTVVPIGLCLFVDSCKLIAE